MPTPRRAAPVVFRPRLTLGLLYVALFFVVYSLLLVLPDLFSVVRSLPAGPEMEAVARERGFEAAREAARGKLHFALVAALVTAGLGLYARILPGAR